MDMSVLDGIEKFIIPTFLKKDYINLINGHISPGAAEKLLADLPKLIAAFFKNEINQLVREITEYEGRDAIQVLLEEYKQISSLPIFTEDQKLTLGSVAEMLSHYYNTAGIIQVYMLVLIKHGYIQSPKN